MRFRWLIPGTALLCLLLVTAAGCGGDDDDGNGGDNGDPEATGTMADGEEEPEATAGEGENNGDGAGALSGPLVLISGAGLFAVDRESGESRAIELSEVDGPAVQTEPAVDGDVAFVLTYAAIEGQSFSSMVYINRIDLTTGDNVRLIEVGFDRETDDSPDLFEYPEIHVASGDVWVVKQPFGPGEHELLRFDGESGELVATITGERLQGFVSDGEQLYQVAGEGLRAVDPATNTFEVILPATGTLADSLPAGTDLAAFFATRSGTPLAGDDLDFAAGTAGRIDAANVSSNGGVRALAYADGALWMSWSTFGIQTQGGDSSIGQGLLRFDLASQTFDAAVPLAGTGEHFLEENVVSAAVGDITWHEGALWVVIPQLNGAIARVDPAALTAEVVYEPCGDGTEFHCDDRDDILFNRSDPEGLWMEFSRLVDQGDGSSTGLIYLVGLDPATGEPVHDIEFNDIFR